MKRVSLFALLVSLVAATAAVVPLPGTLPLTGTNDYAVVMVEGLSQYLARETQATAHRRASSGKMPGTPEERRSRLGTLLGMQDSRDPLNLRINLDLGTNSPAAAGAVGRGVGYQVFPVAWRVFRGVEGEGLLLEPDSPAKGAVVALPDCEWTPEQFVGLAPGLKPDEQLARICAEQGFRVIVPSLIDRGSRFSGNPGVRSLKHSQRETLWRASYEMGRTPMGYELQKVLGAVDWLASAQGKNGESTVGRPSLGVMGYGEGGLLALYAAALDPRIEAAWVSGYFGPREELWQEPIDRNIFGLHREFGDAEVAALVIPRWLWIEAGRYPEKEFTDEHGGAPGRLGRPSEKSVAEEYARIQSIVGQSPAGLGTEVGPGGSGLGRFWQVLTGPSSPVEVRSGGTTQAIGPPPDASARTLRQYRQILEDTQFLMRESEFARRDFWKKADFRTASAFTNSAEGYRDYFRTNIVGVVPPASLNPNVRTRLLGETNGVRRYGVLFDVHPDIIAYGILCVPTNATAGDRRPVVVCQHGLEGRPSDISDPAVASPYYHQYGLRLAERGFVTFAPQNPYIGNTRFRQVLRQAQPLGLTLWSFIVRQHEVITDWLASLDFVDPSRIAFYGLSYGGKTAMRVPVLVDRYCLSICSADYNEWIWKNVSSRSPYSYLWTSEYDMPEWNLGNTFNYAELSWLIFPRPFMVERGHDDGVAPDEWVAYEFAKTRRHYVKQGLADQVEIEFFDGPHSIHGVGTFSFLHRHLNWPGPK